MSLYYIFEPKKKSTIDQSNISGKEIKKTKIFETINIMQCECGVEDWG